VLLTEQVVAELVPMSAVAAEEQADLAVEETEHSFLELVKLEQQILAEAAEVNLTEALTLEEGLVYVSSDININNGNNYNGRFGC
jgi:hypothetical protein